MNRELAPLVKGLRAAAEACCGHRGQDLTIERGFDWWQVRLDDDPEAIIVRFRLIEGESADEFSSVFREVCL